jgi:thiol-disulfide isomerase/thioredoxin
MLSSWSKKLKAFSRSTHKETSMRPMIIFLASISLSAKAQSGKELITAAAQKIATVRTLTYNIYNEKPGEKTTANVTIKRGDKLPVFDLAQFSVSGIVLSDAGSNELRYTYDGGSFQFKDLKTGQLTKLDSPSYSRLSRTGLFPYFSVLLAPYWQEKPFSVVLKQMVVAETFADTTIYRTACHKIKVVMEIPGSGDNNRTSETVWYIGKNDSLVYGFRSSFEKTVLKITSVNEEVVAGAFHLMSDQTVKTMTGLEPLGEGLLEPGTMAPQWRLPSSLGRDIDLKELRGKVVLLDFWGTWCVPCIRAMPDIQAIHNAFLGKPVAVIGVSVETEKAADPIGFVKKKGYTYPIVLNGHNITKDYKVQQFPTLYLIDKNGKIIHAEFGGNRENLKADLISKILLALKE